MNVDWIQKLVKDPCSGGLTIQRIYEFINDDLTAKVIWQTSLSRLERKPKESISKDAKVQMNGFAVEKLKKPLQENSSDFQMQG